MGRGAGSRRRSLAPFTNQAAAVDRSICRMSGLTDKPRTSSYSSGGAVASRLRRKRGARGENGAGTDSILDEWSSFWDERVRRYGHPGWKDPRVYAYDQRARVAAIKAIIDRLPIRNHCALDFGTGCGDFAALLAQRFERVFGFDISSAAVTAARERYKDLANIDFVVASVDEARTTISEQMDLILSITVLDHIMDDRTLTLTLRHLHSMLAQGGFLVALEYAPDSERQRGLYQRFTTYQEWCRLFEQCGFALAHRCGFFHPVDAPCPSYVRYMREIRSIRGGLARLWRAVAGLENGWAHLDEVAARSIEGCADFFGPGLEASPLKIMVLSKGLHGA